MPWNSDYYQCRPLPDQCTRQFTNYDFYGGDFKSVCYATCLATDGCLAYTFVNNYSGMTACTTSRRAWAVRESHPDSFLLSPTATPATKTTPRSCVASLLR
ncbi:hypothetical protein PHYPSEUDO_000733 [Phytophthora pseudosyringae]|uniref:Apple domain-containing protein n=1 Tax=Phytophthora pseudosyringae TaxID=221518 RepID=A0A8T1V2L6_9STRA|nr:hypothetical protein PHYPSEUDO_000733 [Phytophthora pseudosyringae]